MKIKFFKFLFVLSVLSFLSVGCNVKDIFSTDEQHSGISKDYIGNYSGKIDSNQSGTLDGSIAVNDDGSFTFYLGNNNVKFETSNIKSDGNAKYRALRVFILLI